jgi:AAA domain-containing protein
LGAAFVNAAFKFAPAVRERIPLIIGLAGGTGSGKTYTALELATGMAGGKRFGLIDTESGRAKHYADRFAFDHGDLVAPFRPERYQDAIVAAEQLKYPVVVVDSASHEWEGAGGILEWQEEELQRMAGDDWKKREACKMAAWIKPKGAHKHMVARLLQLRCHLILCFRAEEKIEMVRGQDGQMKVQPKQSRAGREGWIPICEKRLPFELTASFLLLADAPGVPRPIKLEEQHRGFFPLDRPIDRAAGKLLNEWAAGGSPAPAKDSIEKLLADYPKCSTAAELAALERRREAFWTRSTSVESKASLSAASKSAKGRLEGKA